MNGPSKKDRNCLSDLEGKKGAKKYRQIVDTKQTAYFKNYYLVISDKIVYLLG